MTNQTPFTWDNTVLEQDSQYVTLPEGDYPFTVTAFAKKYTKGTGKLPAGIPMASMTLELEGAAGRATSRENLIVHRAMEWRLSSFFRCIGQKQRGQRLSVDWDAVLGACGYGHFKPERYVGSDGRTYDSMVCTKFYDQDQYGSKGRYGSEFELPWQ